MDVYVKNLLCGNVYVVSGEGSMWVGHKLKTNNCRRGERVVRYDVIMFLDSSVNALEISNRQNLVQACDGVGRCSVLVVAARYGGGIEKRTGKVEVNSYFQPPPQKVPAVGGGDRHDKEK